MTTTKLKHIPTSTRGVPVRPWSFLIRHLARAAIVLAASAFASPAAVLIERVLDGGLQPQTAVDRDDRPTGPVDTAPGVPAGSFAAAYAEGEGNFVLLY